MTGELIVRVDEASKIVCPTIPFLGFRGAADAQPLLPQLIIARHRHCSSNGFRTGATPSRPHLTLLFPMSIHFMEAGVNGFWRCG